MHDLPGLPEYVKLGGQTWQLRRTSIESDLNLFGRTKVRHSLIEIDNDQSPGQERDTVLHELLHAIASVIQVFADPGEEERAVSAISPWLLSLVRDNPELIAYLTSVTVHDR